MSLLTWLIDLECSRRFWLENFSEHKKCILVVSLVKNTITGKARISLEPVAERYGDTVSGRLRSGLIDPDVNWRHFPAASTCDKMIRFGKG